MWLCCAANPDLSSQIHKTCKVWKRKECIIHILPRLLNYITSDKETVVFQDANDRRPVITYISDSKWDTFGLTVNLIPTNFNKQSCHHRPCLFPHTIINQSL